MTNEELEKVALKAADITREVCNKLTEPNSTAIFGNILGRLMYLAEMEEDANDPRAGQITGPVGAIV